jgi:hypothetical protein
MKLKRFCRSIEFSAQDQNTRNRYYIIMDGVNLLKICFSTRKDAFSHMWQNTSNLYLAYSLTSITNGPRELDIWKFVLRQIINVHSNFYL